MGYNVLLISHERKMGGANHSLVELAEQLLRKGNDVTVAVLYHGCPIDQRLRQMGIRTLACPFGWWQQPAYWNAFMKAAFRILHALQWFSARHLSHYVKKHDIQVIHSNSSVIDIGAQTAACAGCKHVWHFREFGAEDYRLEYMLGRERSLQYVTAHSDAVIFISEALKQAYADMPDDAQKYVIYDGIIDDDELGDWENVLSRKTKNEKSYAQPYTFLVTGNITEGKNQHLVLEAAHILQNGFAENGESLQNLSTENALQQNGSAPHDHSTFHKEFRILFAGAVTSLAESKEYKKKLEEDCKRWNLEDHVTFLGYVEDMPDLRKRVNAEIIPSKCEAYGRVTLEAMKSGNLVIASDSGANPELLGEGSMNRELIQDAGEDGTEGATGTESVNSASRGLVFHSGDAKDLAEKMQYAMEHASDFHIQEEAYRYVFREHRRETAAEKVIEIYEPI